LGLFFIDTDTGQVATLDQLMQAGIAPNGSRPGRPWHRIQGPRDASTMWYAVLRRRIARRRGSSGDEVFIGALAIRHQPHHASLLEAGWEEVSLAEIGVDRTERGDDQAM
jgi:hypothetical protein